MHHTRSNHPDRTVRTRAHNPCPAFIPSTEDVAKQLAEKDAIIAAQAKEIEDPSSRTRQGGPKVPRRRAPSCASDGAQGGPSPRRRQILDPTRQAPGRGPTVRERQVAALKISPARMRC